jgi:hypothetical protein
MRQLDEDLKKEQAEQQKTQHVLNQIHAIRLD